MVKIKKDKKGYYFRARFGKDANGDPIQIYKSGFKKKGDAEDCYFQLRQEILEQKTGTNDQPSNEPFCDLMDKWFHTIYKGEVAETTAQTRWYAIQKHIVPYFGTMPICEITTLMVDEFYHDKLDEGLAPKTVREFHNLLKKAFAQAIKWSKLKVNPVISATPPKACQLSEVNPWEEDQAKQFLKAVERAGDDTFYVVALFTGMRRGEILGLKWVDIDFKQGKIHVRRSLARVKGKGLILKEVKTKTSKRQISISPYVVEKLQQHRENQQALIQEMHGEFNEQGMVFCSSTGNFKDPDNLLRKFARYIEQAKVPKCTIHDLRHYHATQLLKNGVHPKVVSERLGHSRIGIIMDLYSHSTPDLQEDAALQMEKKFFAA